MGSSTIGSSVVVQSPSSVQLFAAPYVVAHQAPLSSKFLPGESSSLGNS